MQERVRVVEELERRKLEKDKDKIGIWAYVERYDEHAVTWRIHTWVSLPITLAEL